MVRYVQKGSALLLTVAAVLGGVAAYGDGKKPLDEETYKKWRRTSNEQISKNGKWVTYELKDRDSLKVTLLVGEGRVDTLHGAFDAQLSPNSEYLFYKVDEDKKKKGKVTFRLRSLKSGEIRKIDEVRSALFIPTDKAILQLVKASSDSAIRCKSLVDLSLVFLTKSDTVAFKNVRYYRFSKKSELLLVVTEAKDTAEVKLFDLRTGLQKSISREVKRSVKLATFSKDLSRLAYISTEMKDRKGQSRIAFYSLKSGKLIDSIGIDSPLLPQGYCVDSQKVDFSEKGDRLYFKLAAIDKSDTTAKSDGKKVFVDIWGWDNSSLPTLSKKRIEEVSSHFCAYDLKRKKLVMLSDAEMPFLQFPEGANGGLTLGFSNLKYLRNEGIEPSVQYDSYLVDMESGAKRLILEKKIYNPTISFDKRYIAWFEPEDSSWYSMNTKTLVRRNLTKSISDIFYNNELDEPRPMSHTGFVGWEDRDHSLLVSSKYDLWKIDAEGQKAPICLTKGVGKADGISLKLIQESESQRYYSLKKSYYFSAFQDETKKSGFYLLDSLGNIRKLVLSDHMYSNPIFSKVGPCIWMRQNFTECPEIFMSNSDFTDVRKLSVINPQQKDYIWGDASLVSWVSFNGKKLKGILVKPENFDSTKCYPMLVYFYEKRSDNLNRYVAPAPISTVINWTYCASNGYLVFIPDVKFRVGEPGSSSFDAVISGVTHLIDRCSYIDRNRIGLNGHSWGGYQIAYLVTRTDMFKAAVAGAPVANMTSAYGGMRMGSGKSRMFQYEKGQSRIGGTLWEKLPYYISNSPLFALPNVNTPVLIMHNDKDGSVPWEQGVELFLGLRRLNKSAWLLNYKGEDHKLAKWDNRIDYARKVMSFYDYYLKGAPKPSWM